MLESGRGLGIGSSLVNACVEFSRSNGAKLRVLQSYRKLAVALAMYERMVFVDMQPRRK